MSELPQEVHSRIADLCHDADVLAEQGHTLDALRLYDEAWVLLPDPKEQWEAATWILAAIGDTQFTTGAFASARKSLAEAMHCPGAIGNPFLHLRLGQCQLELGNMERANDELTRAYMGGGADIFAGEDAKYFNHLKSVLREPIGGW